MIAAVDLFLPGLLLILNRPGVGAATKTFRINLGTICPGIPREQRVGVYLRKQLVFHGPAFAGPDNHLTPHVTICRTPTRPVAGDVLDFLAWAIDGIESCDDALHVRQYLNVVGFLMPHGHHGAAP